MDVRYERYGMMGDIQYLMELQGRENYRFSVTEVAGPLAKADRIRRLIPLFEQSKFYLPETLHYTDREGVTRDLVGEFVEKELCAFPAGLHDDMLDSLARITDTEGRVNGNATNISLVWPMPDEDPHKVMDRYARRARETRRSPWAA
jgi:hypothetical protein